MQPLTASNACPNLSQTKCGTQRLTEGCSVTAQSRCVGLNRQMATDQIGSQIGHFTIGDHPTLFHQEKVFADAARKCEVLLDQDDGEILVAVQPLQDVADLCDDVWSNALVR